MRYHKLHNPSVCFVDVGWRIGGSKSQWRMFAGLTCWRRSAPWGNRKSVVVAYLSSHFVTHASTTERTRPARYQGATGRSRQRDRAPRIPLRGAQPDPPCTGALPRTAAAQHLWPLHAADHGQEQVLRHRAWARSDRRVWAVSCRFFLSFP